MAVRWTRPPVWQELLKRRRNRWGRQPSPILAGRWRRCRTVGPISWTSNEAWTPKTATILPKEVRQDWEAKYLVVPYPVGIWWWVLEILKRCTQKRNRTKVLQGPSWSILTRRLCREDRLQWFLRPAISTSRIYNRASWNGLIYARWRFRDVIDAADARTRRRSSEVTSLVWMNRCTSHAYRHSVRMRQDSQPSCVDFDCSYRNAVFWEEG